MFDILLSASAYALIIVVGAVCSHTGFIKSETKNVFSRLLFNITLPCTVVYSFVGFQFDASLLLVSAVSFAATVVGFGGVVCRDGRWFRRCHAVHASPQARRSHDSHAYGLWL